MPSFQIAINPNRRAAARFILYVRRALQKALVEEQKISGITQSDIARKIGIHRSVISRELNGREDITLGRIAELAWALGREISFSLPKTATIQGDNTLPNPGFVQKVQISASTSVSRSNPPSKDFKVEVISV